MALRVALDTNRLSDLLAGDAILGKWLEPCECVGIPLIVLAEIRAGFLGGSQPQRNEARLVPLLAQTTVNVLLPDRETAEHYARLRVQLRRAGKPIPTNDIWIAALALQHDLSLVTRDRHFAAIPQLTLQTPAPRP